MKYIHIKNIKDDSILQKRDFISSVTFIDSDTCNTVAEACSHGVNTLKSWFNTIGIEYTKIIIVHNTIRYVVDGIVLSLSDLSSGERYMLYLLACKQLHKELIAGGLFERLGSRLETVATNIVKDYDELTIIVYNAYIPKELKQFEVKEI